MNDSQRKQEIFAQLAGAMPRELQLRTLERMTEGFALFISHHGIDAFMVATKEDTEGKQFVLIHEGEKTDTIVTVLEITGGVACNTEVRFEVDGKTARMSGDAFAKSFTGVPTHSLEDALALALAKAASLGAWLSENTEEGAEIAERFEGGLGESGIIPEAPQEQDPLEVLLSKGAVVDDSPQETARRQDARDVAMGIMASLLRS